MDIIEKARCYISRVPAAISGNGGHDQTFWAACALINGFALSDSDAFSLLQEYNQTCQPPWTDRELAHKISDAAKVPHEKPRGYLLNGVKHTFKGVNGAQRISPPPAVTPPPAPKTSAPAKPAPKRYVLEGDIQLPKPIANGAKELLLAAFKPGEGVRMCLGSLNSEGREQCDQGAPLTREEWLSRLESVKGDPNKLMMDNKNRCGIYISVNPMKLLGSKDQDVTAYRHCLLEFDEITLQEQWTIITKSRIPATAVISSGGRSLHAWVKVDARNRQEFDERVKLLYAHFSEYKPDEANKNVSRYSRLPNCIRFKARQELLALNLGAESFVAWQVEQDAAVLGTEILVADLLEFNADSDKNSVLGNRWLCRGGSCLVVGQSGIGKSSLEMQLAILWAIERPAFGICPVKPLKSLIIQAENDLGDTAEMFQGVWKGMKLPGGEQPEVIRQVQKNLAIRRVSSHTGTQFCDLLRRVIDVERPDLVWLDPALAYLGDDISKQSVCSEFFRNGLNPIAEATGVIFMILHHTGKPAKDPKSKSGWTASDFSYEGLGSSDVVNWARAVMVLKKFDENLFELMFPKRGKRAGVRDDKGNFIGGYAPSLWLKHADRGICWEQVEAPTEEEKESVRSKGKKRTKPPVNFNYTRFLETIAGEHFNVIQLVDRASKFARIGTSTVYNDILPELKKKMIYDPDHRTFTI